MSKDWTVPMRGGGVHPVRAAGPPAASRRLFIRDLVVPCEIGVHAHEKGNHQRVRINVTLTMASPEPPRRDRIAEVVSYDDVIDGIRALTSQGHISLVETLAERIADLCSRDQRVSHVQVMVEKLDVVPDAASVGVVVERWYDRDPPPRGS